VPINNCNPESFICSFFILQHQKSDNKKNDNMPRSTGDVRFVSQLTAKRITAKIGHANNVERGSVFFVSCITLLFTKKFHKQDAIT
jgi:hypothetical protein